MKVENDPTTYVQYGITSIERKGNVNENIIANLIVSNGVVNAFNFISGAEVVEYVSEHSVGHNSVGEDIIGGVSTKDEGEDEVDEAREVDVDSP